jgi:hypothetical protein
MPQANFNQLDAAFKAMRAFIDASGYGRIVSDAHCRDASTAVAEAVLAVTPPTPPPSPTKAT